MEDSEENVQVDIGTERVNFITMIHSYNIVQCSYPEDIY